MLGELSYVVIRGDPYDARKANSPNKKHRGISPCAPTEIVGITLIEKALLAYHHRHLSSLVVCYFGLLC